jgi:hypothetical protein
MYALSSAHTRLRYKREAHNNVRTRTTDHSIHPGSHTDSGDKRKPTWAVASAGCCSLAPPQCTQRPTPFAMRTWRWRPQALRNGAAARGGARGDAERPAPVARSVDSDVGKLLPGTVTSCTRRCANALAVRRSNVRLSGGGGVADAARRHQMWSTHS